MSYFDKKMKGAYIFDLDGTLCDCTPRVKKYLDGKDDWEGFYAHCEDDYSIDEVCDVLVALSEMNFDILFVTGRRESTRQATLSWLRERFGDKVADSSKLFMRSAKDGHCADYVSKVRNYREHIEGKWAVRGVFEDRSECVRMWRDLGLKCFQVDWGEY